MDGVILKSHKILQSLCGILTSEQSENTLQVRGNLLPSLGERGQDVRVVLLLLSPPKGSGWSFEHLLLNAPHGFT